MFDAHAAAEKFLKVAFHRSGDSRNIRDFSHNASKLFQELTKLDSRYKWLVKSVELLQRLVPNMLLRYETVNISLEMAVEAVHASLFLSGTLSCMWNFDHQREGASAEFRPARFYVNSDRTKFYCKTKSKDEVILTYFESNRFTGSQMADIKCSASNCHLYLEVTRLEEEEACIGQFTLQLRHPGKKVSPEEIRLRTIDSAEGVYTTAILRRQTQSEEQ